MCICYGWVVGYGHACFFFFKQKTAYEMRISDWSSDVCSSDLRWGGRAIANQSAGSLHDRASETPAASVAAGKTQAGGGGRLAVKKAGPAYCPMTRRWCEHESRKDLRRGRSEEHTSELQSLMRISYAVFCLKNKKMKTGPHHTYH